MAPQREWFEKDYYKVLGVSDTASDKEITRAYRKLAKQYHPDANPGAEDRFKEISAAYDVLGDAAKRKEYDEVRRLGPVANPFGGAGGGGRGLQQHVPRRRPLRPARRHLRPGRPGRARRAARPGRGGARTSRPSCTCRSSTPCTASPPPSTSPATWPAHTCGGTGAAPGTSPVICSVCGGRGVINDNQGLFSFSQPCRECGGTGMRVETPCPTCRGRGIERRARQVKVRIPAGVEDGQRIRVKARGGAGRQRRPARRPVRGRAHRPPRRCSAARART